MEKLLGINEVSDIMGVKINTLYSWVHQNKIPHLKIGRLVKFRQSDLERWLEGKTIQVRKNLEN